MDDEAKLTLHGLVQHYVMLNEEEKNRKLSDLLDALDFNQVWTLILEFTSARRLDILLYCSLRSAATVYNKMKIVSEFDTSL